MDWEKIVMWTLGGTAASGLLVFWLLVSALLFTEVPIFGVLLGAGPIVGFLIGLSPQWVTKFWKQKEYRE